MTVIRAGLLTLACLVFSVHAEENCSDWRSADVDPANGKFEIELRTCELPYGLSAYIQMRNSSEDKVALSYRLLLKDHTNKDNDIVLDAGAMMRTETCQACAKRNAGLDSWQILSVKSLGKADADPATITSTPTPPPVRVEAAKNHVVTPMPTTTVQRADTRAPATPVKVESPPKATEKKLTEKDGFRAEDGTIIPWSQLPPEFRPRKQE